MKSQLTSLFLLSSSAIFAEESFITFGNGDRLTGSPMSLDEDGHLVWKSPSFLTGEIEVFTETVDSIFFQDVPKPQEETESATTKLLFYPHYDRSNDTLHGNLQSFNEDTIVIDTWFAGPLELKRSMLRSIEVDNAEPALFSGPGPLASWTLLGPPNSWTASRDKFISSNEGTLARSFPNLPKQYLLSLTLEFPFPPTFQILFSASSGNTTNPQNSYTLIVSPHSVQLRKRFENSAKNLSSIEPPQLPFLEDVSKSKLDLYIDHEAGEFTLYIDDLRVCQWNDDKPNPVDEWIHLSSRRQSQRTTLSKFFLRSWDGQLPQFTPDNERTELDTEEPTIELQNGDTIVGVAKNIEDGSLIVETEFAPLSVPLDRLKTLEVTSYEEREEPRMWQGDVRAFFYEGGHVTLRMSDLTETTITGYSQIFGDATFQLAAFSRIEFNPYEEEFRTLRGQSF